MLNIKSNDFNIIQKDFNAAPRSNHAAKGYLNGRKLVPWNDSETSASSSSASSSSASSSSATSSSEITYQALDSTEKIEWDQFNENKR